MFACTAHRVSSQGAFEGLELGEGKRSGPVLRGPGGRLCSRSNGTDRGIPHIVSEYCLEIKKIGKAIKRLGFELS
jgi:hypothetical protein